VSLLTQNRREISLFSFLLLSFCRVARLMSIVVILLGL